MSGRIEVMEPAASAAGSKALAATLAGGGMLSFGGLTANDIAIFIGAVVALAGLLLQWHFQRRRDRREQAEHRMRAAEHEALMTEREARIAERGFYDAG